MNGQPGVTVCLNLTFSIRKVYGFAYFATRRVSQSKGCAFESVASPSFRLTLSLKFLIGKVDGLLAPESDYCDHLAPWYTCTTSDMSSHTPSHDVHEFLYN